MWYDQWTDTVTPVHAFPPGTFSFNLTPSKSGTIAFYWTNFDGSTHLARWSDDFGFEEAVLSEDVLSISADAVALDGTTACTALIHPSYHEEPFVWESESQTPYSVNSLLPDNPITSHMVEMNEDGDMLVRSGSEFFLLEPRLAADLNQDELVNVTDILLLLNAWGESPTESCSPDINRDGIVNLSDLLLIINAWH